MKSVYFRGRRVLALSGDKKTPSSQDRYGNGREDIAIDHDSWAQRYDSPNFGEAEEEGAIDESASGNVSGAVTDADAPEDLILGDLATASSFAGCFADVEGDVEIDSAFTGHGSRSKLRGSAANKITAQHISSPFKTGKTDLGIAKAETGLTSSSAPAQFSHINIGKSPEDLLLQTNGAGNVTQNINAAPDQSSVLVDHAAQAKIIRPLIFRSPTSFVFYKRKGGYPYPQKTWNGTIEYTTDESGNSGWTEWDAVSPINATNGILYLRGTSNTIITGSTGYGQGFAFEGGPIYGRGRLAFLLDYQKAISWSSEPPKSSNCFYTLFKGCENLITAPEVPGRLDVPDWCFASCFEGCVNLETIQGEIYINSNQAYAACYRMYYGCAKIKVSKTKTEEYKNEIVFRGANPSTWSQEMLTGTSGTFTSDPTMTWGGKKYYTSNEISV